MRNDIPSACSLVVDVHAKACSDLIAAYGLINHLRREQRHESAPHRVNYASVLCATGDGIRLSSTLSTDAELLERTHPAAGSTRIERRDVEDWCRELNNQLMGRVKNKLLRLGCEMTTGIPVLICGTGIAAVTPSEVDHRQYFFSSDYGCMTFTLAMALSPAVDLAGGNLVADADEVRPEGAHSIF
jgi:hypothetical protein